MPSAACHSFYWQAEQAQAPPPALGGGRAGGYVPWQTTVICGGGFGVMQVVWEWAVRQSQTAWPVQQKDGHGNAQ